MRRNIPQKNNTTALQVAAAGTPTDRRTPLTRGQVAKDLRMGVTSVRRREGKSLHPTTRADGVHVFDPAEVAELVAQRTTASEAKLRRSADGDLAAEAFKQFNRGLDMRAVVIELRQPPALIQELHRQWREAGGLWIPSAALVAIRKAIKARYPDHDAIRIATPQDLMDAVDHILNDLVEARARHWDGVDQIAELRREKRALREKLRECRAEVADWVEAAASDEEAATPPSEEGG
jgi:hypothetical protein